MTAGDVEGRLAVLGRRRSEPERLCRFVIVEEEAAAAAAAEAAVLLAVVVFIEFWGITTRVVPPECVTFDES